MPYGRAEPVQVGAAPAYWSNPERATCFSRIGLTRKDRWKWSTRAGYKERHCLECLSRLRNFPEEPSLICWPVPILQKASSYLDTGGGG